MNKIEFGDCRDVMRQWAKQGVKVQMCVTSPPYYQLRSYGTETWEGGDVNCNHLVDRSDYEKNFKSSKQATIKGTSNRDILKHNTCPKCGAKRIDKQLGLEESVEEYVENLVEVFRCVKDVLKDDGTVWLNLGDSYAGNCSRVSQGRAGLGAGRDGIYKKGGDLPAKNLIGVPWRVAFALQADGWILRQEIIWHKTNALPSSATDRCTGNSESVFLLAKKPKYFFDNEAIKEKAKYAGDNRGARSYSRRETECNSMSGETYEMRNKRSVWTIPTKPFGESHFASYPPALILPCILAGTSAKGECPYCGKAWIRITEKTRLKRNELDKSDPRYRPNVYNGSYSDINGKSDAGYTSVETLGWKQSCGCKEHEAIPQTVLDPFMGSGTTAMVAKENGRFYLGCDLNPDYKKMQDKRIKSVIYQRRMFE